MTTERRTYTDRSGITFRLSKSGRTAIAIDKVTRKALVGGAYWRVGLKNGRVREAWDPGEWYGVSEDQQGCLSARVADALLRDPKTKQPLVVAPVANDAKAADVSTPPRHGDVVWVRATYIVADICDAAHVEIEALDGARRPKRVELRVPSTSISRH